MDPRSYICPADNRCNDVWRCMSWYVMIYVMIHVACIKIIQMTTGGSSHLIHSSIILKYTKPRLAEQALSPKGISWTTWQPFKAWRLLNGLKNLSDWSFRKEGFRFYMTLAIWYDMVWYGMIYELLCVKTQQWQWHQAMGWNGLKWEPSWTPAQPPRNPPKCCLYIL